MKLILISLIVGLTFSSCAAYRKTVDAIAEHPELVEPTVSAAVSLVFSKAIDEADRKVKAEQVSKVADKILDAKFTTKPTKAEVTELLAKSLPDGWGAALASTISGYYVRYTASIDPSDVEKSVSVLKSIAGGIKVASAKYL